MNSLEFGDAIVTPVPDDPDTFIYAPRAPVPARDANGKPQLNLLKAGPVSFLQLTAQWGLDTARAVSLKAEVANRLGRDAASVRLQPADDTVRSVTLLLGDGSGELKPFQEGRSSGVPPYQAVFNVMLTDEQREKVQRGLAGERGFLAVRYELTRAHPFAAGVGLFGGSLDASVSHGDGSSRVASVESTLGISAEERGTVPEQISAQADAADWNSNS